MGSIAGSTLRRGSRRAITAVLVLASVVSARAVAQTALTPAAIEAMADRHFGKAREAGGAAVVTVVKDGQVIFAKGYGAANPKTGAPVDPAATLFRIGSITKVFTAITALRLIERGVIDPDADVNRYLAKVGVRIRDRYETPVTMRALLALQAGRFDWTYSYYYPLHDDRQTRLPPDEISRRLWRTAPPGDVSAYDNNGVGLIGFVAEAAAGKPYRELVRDEVLLPLGMAKSVSGIPNDRVPEMVGCADPDPTTAYRSCPYDLIAEHLRPSGGITVTAADMARLLTMLLDGSRGADTTLLSVRSWREFLDFDARELDPRLPAWGTIIYEVFTRGRYSFGHDGGIGKFAALVRIYPASGIGLFVDVQSGLDWEDPAVTAKRLSEVPAMFRVPTPSPAQREFLAGRAAFEADFAETFVPAGPPPGAERAGSTPVIPENRLGGRYWRLLAKGKRYWLLEMLDRMEPPLSVEVAGPDRLRITLPGAPGPTDYRRSGPNAFQDSAGSPIAVFASAPRGIYLNWTASSVLSYYYQVPWHYRPWVSIYPLPLALLALITSWIYWLASRGSAADRRLAAAFGAGGLLVTTGVLAELEFVLPVLYHGGHVLPALVWRVAFHAGLVLLVVAVVRMATRFGTLARPAATWRRALKGGYVMVLGIAALVTVGLVGYWGLIGSFTK